jgi:large exoprotein involved in heme utilization and adhesion
LLVTPNNNLNLISVAAKGEVPVVPADFSDNAFTNYGTLSIIDTTTSRPAGNVDTSSPNGGGEIFIRSGQFFLDNGWVFADTFGNEPGQGITIDVAETLALTNASRITTEVYDFDENVYGKANGDGGSIAITAGDIQIMGGSQIAATTRSVGNAGDITVLADTNLLISGLDSSGLFSSGVLSNTNSSGQGGNMFIAADTLLMDANAQINAETHTGSGNAGNLALQVKTLEMQGGASITIGSGNQSNFQGTGNGGSLTIEATDAILIKGKSAIQPTALASNTFTQQGQGGKIKISASVVTVEDTGTIQTLTVFDGNAGHISLDVDTLNLREGGKILTNSIVSNGLGGNIDIVANNLLEITGNETGIAAATSSLGNGGNIIIQAGKLRLANSGGISASSTGSGNAGNIVVRLGDKLSIQKGSIRTATIGADGGDIVITAPSYVYLADGEITTSVGAEDGNGGNITLTPKFIIQDNGKIIAQAVSGDGGNINVTTKGIFKFSPQSASPIDASSRFGVDGIVIIASPDEDVSEDMVILPSTFADLSKMLKNLCEAKQIKTSQFVVVNFVGSPPSPYDWKASRLLPVDFVEQAQSMTNKVGEVEKGIASPFLLLASGCNKKN